MNYYIREVQTSDELQKTAGIKARDDMEYILSGMNMEGIAIPSQNDARKKAKGISKILWHWKIRTIWRNHLKFLKAGDQIYIQFPIIEHSLLLASFIKKLKAKGIRITLIIHDLEFLRVAKRSDTSIMKKIRLNLEEKKMLANCTNIIVHNDHMKQYLQSLGIPGEKMIDLEIFDYIIADADEEYLKERILGKEQPLIIAGNLRPHKARYVYSLPDNMEFNLYGVGYEPKKSHDNIHYKGSFQPDELPYVMNGSFGVVWDGNTGDTCSGVYGEYLKINNPHKTSLYLASEIPVLIWKNAALADFVKKYHCGITVNSLKDIPFVLSQMNDESYAVLCEGAKKAGKMLRSGYFTEKAIQESQK